MGYKQEAVGAIEGRIWGPSATIRATKEGFVVSDDCLLKTQFFFKKTQEKEAREKFLLLNK